MDVLTTAKSRCTFIDVMVVLAHVTSSYKCERFLGSMGGSGSLAARSGSAPV